MASGLGSVRLGAREDILWCFVSLCVCHSPSPYRVSVRREKRLLLFWGQGRPEEAGAPGVEISGGGGGPPASEAGLC